jgi:trehalose 6-phosphate synthase/phosphatase
MSVIIDRSPIIEAYRKSEKRILFLDYDGTLVSFSDLPENSILGEEVRSIVIKLTSDPRNHIYIISGRDKEFLARQFSGIRTGLIAEHGYLRKETDGEWISSTLLPGTWKNAVMKFFQEFSLRYPGTFIEEKESSVAYHYRTAVYDLSGKISNGMRQTFLVLQQQYPGLELLVGNKVMEIKPESFNKGRTAHEILRNGQFDFIMAAGDDLTDENLFAELPQPSFTIKIGLPPTSARYYISSQKKFIGFLKELQQSKK